VGTVLEAARAGSGVKVKHVSASDYRVHRSIEVQEGRDRTPGPKLMWRLNNNYANVERSLQVQQANGSLGYRSCLIVHSDSDIFSPETSGENLRLSTTPNSTSGYLVPSAFLPDGDGIDPKTLFSKLTFSGPTRPPSSPWQTKKVDVASTNLPDLQQLVREGKVPRAALRVIWVSKLIPLDPVVIRKTSRPACARRSRIRWPTMKTRSPQAFVEGGAFWVASQGRRLEVPDHPRPERRRQEAGRAEIALWISRNGRHPDDPPGVVASLPRRDRRCGPAGCPSEPW